MVTANSISTYEVPTTNRERTMPLQPAFFAYNSTLRTNVTGDGTAYTLIFNTVVLDQNSDYNNTTGVFTAPVTGYYKFFSSVSMDDVDSTEHDWGEYYFDHNAGTASFAAIYEGPSSIDDPAHDYDVNIASGAYLTAADTVSVVLKVTGGAKSIDVNTTWVTSFSGALMF